MESAFCTESFYFFLFFFHFFVFYLFLFPFHWFCYLPWRRNSFFTSLQKGFSLWINGAFDKSKTLTAIPEFPKSSQIFPHQLDIFMILVHTRKNLEVLGDSWLYKNKGKKYSVLRTRRYLFFNITHRINYSVKCLAKCYKGIKCLAGISRKRIGCFLLSFLFGRLFIQLHMFWHCISFHERTW